MSWFDSSLSYWVRHQEEIKDSIDNLWLLDKSIVDVGSLRRILDTGCLVQLEESLPYSLVDDDESVLW